MSITSTMALRRSIPAMPFRPLLHSKFRQPLQHCSRHQSSYFSPTQAAVSTRWTPPLVKIVATIGPTSEQIEVLQPLVSSGVRVMRLNFSHATYEEAQLRLDNLRKCKGRNRVAIERQDNMRAVLLDTQGPEIRTGKLQGDDDGRKSIVLETGLQITLRTDAAAQDAGSTAQELFINYKDLAHSVQVGSTILLDDGAVALTATQVDAQAGTVQCTIDNTGELRSRAGVNLPGSQITLPPMSDKDKQDIRYGLTKDMDYIAASFVRDAKGVRAIRAFVQQSMQELGLEGPPPLIISKVENTEALVNFEEILEASDGIMVARGDLGVEIPIYHVTTAQKKMVTACNAAGKPVIVATQMLETMAKNPRPTRAEVSDVSNAVLDGADCVMLSGETAKGKYPVETVRTMTSIIRSSEVYEKELGLNSGRKAFCSADASKFEAVALAAVKAAEQSQATAIIVLTKTGQAARLVAKYRPSMPILCFCPNYKVGRQLMLHRGIHPYIARQPLDRADRPAAAVDDAAQMGFLERGDTYVMVMAEKTVSAEGDDVEFPTMRIGHVA